MYKTQQCLPASAGTLLYLTEGYSPPPLPVCRDGVLKVHLPPSLSSFQPLLHRKMGHEERKK